MDSYLLWLPHEMTASITRSKRVRFVLRALKSNEYYKLYTKVYMIFFVQNQSMISIKWHMEQLHMEHPTYFINSKVCMFVCCSITPKRLIDFNKTLYENKTISYTLVSFHKKTERWNHSLFIFWDWTKIFQTYNVLCSLSLS